MKKFIFTLGTTAILSAGFAGGASASGNDTYQVQKGDTLWSIAQNHDVSVDELKDVNNLTSTIIHPEQNLNVSIIKEITHKVERGDTLWSISQKYGVTVEQIKAWNGLGNDLIIPGQVFAIETSGGSQAVAQPAPAPKAEPVQEAAPAPKEEPAEQPAPEAEQKQEPAQEAAAPAPQPEPAKEEQPAEQSQQSGKQLTVEATAYTASCEGCSGVTATGVDLKANPNQKVIAVDPSVIPLGSKVYVEGYGEAIAADTGGAIKGNKIDVFVPAQADAKQWGRKTVNITVLD